MKSRIIFCFIVLSTLFLAISAISASENITCDNSTLTVADNCEILSEDNRNATEFSAENKVSYADYNDNFAVKLTSNGKGLAGKHVIITLNNVSYNKTTDSNGQVSINFKLKFGSYKVKYSFEGDENYSPSNGTSKLTVSSHIPTSLSVVDTNKVYQEGLKTSFQLRLADINGNGISSKTVSINVGGKKYTAKTNADGIATFYLKLDKGLSNVKYSFDRSDNYLSSSGTHNIDVKVRLSNGYGYWVADWSMKKVSLKKLSKKGTKHIFLLHTAFSTHGKKTVLNWIKKAHKYGIKVHIWVPIFHKNGKFIKPCTKAGKLNYKYMNKKIKLVKYYASLDGVDGIQFDYIRFSGDAYKYKNSVKAINYFVKKASASIRSVKEDIIVSAAVMAEPAGMKYHYAQDISTMSKHFDVLIPMVYKGNYHASSKWIKKITKQFVKLSKGAKIWAGIQSYKSDSNIKKLSYKSLLKDAKNAKKGGACGVVSFRWGLSALLNFNKL